VKVNIIDEYKSSTTPVQNTTQALNYKVTLSLVDDFFATQNLVFVQRSTPIYSSFLQIFDLYSSTPGYIAGTGSSIGYPGVSLSLIDDYQADSIITITRGEVEENPNFIVDILDTMGFGSIYIATPHSATPSGSFIVRIVDDFGDTPDEWVLITEDGFIISLEPVDDEFGITVE
jgi:hypothetical protein